MSENVRNKTISNLIWRFAERSGAQAVSFVVSIVIARMLEPEAYGIIALITVFTAVLQVFIDSGLGNALIQKKDADDLDFSTVFYFNLTVCVIMYVLMFAAAPLIASFYENEELVPLIRVLSLVLIISGVKNVQQAFVSRGLMFKRFFFATLGGTIGAAVIGLVMAWAGFGVWALVAQMLFNAAVDTLILWLTVRWRPKLMFSFSRLRGLLSFGWKILVSALIYTTMQQIRQLIIGKVYTKADLAYYNKGNRFPFMIISNINTSIDSVMLPTMAKVQNDTASVKNMIYRSITVSTFVMAPLMVGLAVISKNTVLLLLTEKWLPCVPYMQVFCIGYILYPVHTANLNAIKAVGRSDIFLFLEVIKNVLDIVTIFVTVTRGPFVIAIGSLLLSFVCLVVNAAPAGKLFDYYFYEQMEDLLPAALLSLLMGAGVALIGMLPLPLFPLLVVQVLSGGIIYFAGAYFLNLEVFRYVFETAMGFLKKKKNKTERSE